MALDFKTLAALDFLSENNNSEKVDYPYNKAIQTRIGHKIEYNETEGNEYINIRHGTTGAYIKMFASGDIQIHSPSRDINIVAARHINVKCGSKLDIENKDANHRLNINVIGNAHLDVEGDMHLNVKGDRYDRVSGQYFLNVGDKFITTMGEGQVKSTGLYNLDVNKFITTGSNISRNLKEGGIMRDSFAGTYIIEQTSPGGVLKLSSLEDMEIYALGHIRTKTLSNCTYDVGGKVDFTIAGLRVNGTPTGVPKGPLSPTEPSFNVTCAAGAYSATTVLGNVELTATVGTMSLFAGGPYLDVDCLTGVYLN